MKARRLIPCVATFLIQLCLGSSSAETVSFKQVLAPLLLANCHGCHNAETTEGGYSVATFEAVLTAGDSGEPPIVASKPLASELLRRLTTGDPDERMPAESDPLPQPVIDVIEAWIRQGAAFDSDDRSAPLAFILPVTRHPPAPEGYRFPIPITAVSFADGDLIVGGYHEILRWDLDKEQIVQRIPQVGERIYSIDVDANSNRLFVGSGTPGQLGEVRIIEAKTGRLIGVPLTTNEVVLDVALHPAQPLLAAASADHQIHLIDLRENKVTRSLGSHSDWVRSVAWNEEGTQLASASRDKTAKVFNLGEGRPVATYMGHGQDVIGIAFVPGDEGKLISTDSDGKTHQWTASDGKKLKSLPTRSKQAFQLLPSADGVWLASDDPSVIQFAWDGEQQRQQLGPHKQWVLSMAIDPEQHRLATGDLRGTVRIWSLRDGSLINAFAAFPAAK